jgi:hypothetical protein
MAIQFDFQFWAITFDFIGKFLLAFTAFLVHLRLKQEKRIDGRVLKEMKMEGLVGGIALIMLIIAYILHLFMLGDI